MRRINDAGIGLIKKLHPFKAAAYKTSEKSWAIGYGHVRLARKGMTITESQADKLLRSDMVDHSNFVDGLVKVGVSDNQFAALVVFACHIGHDKFERSLLLQLLNRGWHEQVPTSLVKWSRSSKDRRRRVFRAAEAQLWKTPDEQTEQKEAA